MDITYNSIKPFYPFAIDYLVRTLIMSILALFPGAIIFVNSPDYAGKGALITWSIFVVIRLIVLFTYKLKEIQKVGAGIVDATIVLVTGLFSTQKINIPIEYINNYSFSQSFIQKIFKVGNLIITHREITSITPVIDVSIAEKLIAEIQKVKTKNG